MIDRLTITRVFATFLVYTLSLSAAAAESPVIGFDLPATAAAHPVDPGDPHSPVTIELKLSSMIASPTVPRIDQWLLRCQPRDARLSVADYAPRTEVASELSGPINIKRTDEKTDSFGLSIDGSYGHLAHANGGADHSKKKSESVQYERMAPVQAVTAAGTIHRGRGVYFKLRWTSQQVLEGEKTFRITLHVPANWRGGLIDVSVCAQAEHRGFAGFDHEVRTLGSARFVVAAYRAADQEARATAMKLARAEYRLREAARDSGTSASGLSFSAMWKKLAAELNPVGPAHQREWLEQLMFESVDPHVDERIRELPVSLRVAVLEYCERREAFASVTAPEDAARLVAERSDGEAL